MRKIALEAAVEQSLPPGERTWHGAAKYDYRNPILLIFGLLFGGGILFFDIKNFVTGLINPSTLFLTLVVTIPFLAIPYFLLSAYFLESIQFDSGEIVWINRLGKPKVRAKLAEIESIDEVKGDTPLTVLKTPQGTIKFSSLIRDYKGLVSELKRMSR